MKTYNAKVSALLLAIDENYKKVSLEKYLSHKCRVLHLPYGAVWRAITGYATNKRNAKFISEKLSVSLEELFDEKKET